VPKKIGRKIVMSWFCFRVTQSGRRWFGKTSFRVCPPFQEPILSDTSDVMSISPNGENGGLGTGWPDWANFRPFGWLFTLGCVLKITEVVQVLGLLFSHRNKISIFFQRLGRCINLGLGLHFGRFFPKLIWSPCLRSNSAMEVFDTNYM
jgi:hypothetical protein